MTPVYKASGIKSEGRKNRRTKSEIQRIKDALIAVLEADHPQTVRQVFYQMIVKGLVGKTEQEYDGTVCRLLGEMRENEESAVEWIVDNPAGIAGRHLYRAESRRSGISPTATGAICGKTPKIMSRFGSRRMRSRGDC